MNSFRLGTLAVLASASVFASAVQAEYDAHTLLIKTDSTFEPALVNGPIGARTLRNTGVNGWRSVTLASTMTVDQAIAYYRNAPGVLAAEANLVRRPLRNVNDPLAGQQWSLNMIGMPRAWDLSFGSRSVVVAVLDTGVDYTHPDLKNQIVAGGRDFADNDDNPQDDVTGFYRGHGTHCAGIVSASANNGIGVAGIGANLGILPIKVFTSADVSTTTDVLVASMKYATDRGAKVLSMSLGGYGSSTAESDAVQYAWTRNVLTVAAAGNDSLDQAQFKSYPANYPNVLSVASTDSADQLSDFSNYGNEEIDVAAPGSDIMSTLPDNRYGLESGTSMACPLVAGLAGLILSYEPSAKPLQITDGIMKTSSKRTYVISGRVDAFKAVDYFTKSTPLPATLNAKSVFQGTSTTGSGSLINVRSLRVNGVGQVAAARFDMTAPAMPYNRMRASEFTFAGPVVPNATMQLFMWSYSQSRWDIMNAQPSGNGTFKLSMGVLPSQYLDANGKFSFVARALVPNRQGYSAQPFTFSLNSAAATFRYSQNSL